MKNVIGVIVVFLFIMIAGDALSDNPDTKLPAEQCHFEKGECPNENCPEGNNGGKRQLNFEYGLIVNNTNEWLLYDATDGRFVDTVRVNANPELANIIFTDNQ